MRSTFSAACILDKARLTKLIFGQDYEDNLETFNRLGVVYTKQKIFEQAAKMFIAATSGREKVLGREHPLTVRTLDNLAKAYFDQHKPEAEYYFVQVLERKEVAFGPNHLGTLETVDRLGEIWTNQRRFLEGEKKFLRVMLGREKALGLKDPLTMQTVDRLGKSCLLRVRP